MQPKFISDKDVIDTELEITGLYLYGNEQGTTLSHLKYLTRQPLEQFH